MSINEVIKEFPIGAVVYLTSYQEKLMTVMGHTGEDKVKTTWFDEHHHAHDGIYPSASLRVRVEKPK